MRITRENMNEFTVSGEFEIASETEGLRTILRFVMVDVPVGAIIASSLKDKRINVQIRLRAHPELYKNGQVVPIPYAGGSYEDPKSAYDRYVEGLSPEMQKAELEARIAQLEALKK
jgi:hypothetical protein